MDAVGRFASVKLQCLQAIPSFKNRTKTGKSRKKSKYAQQRRNWKPDFSKLPVTVEHRRFEVLCPNKKRMAVPLFNKLLKVLSQQCFLLGVFDFWANTLNTPNTSPVKLIKSSKYQMGNRLHSF